ncbi:hypothetical protein HK100_004989 [Physocladia obscura]|uniref:Uncharacterized protein n=1 Tax=Physocladia obscura TaxID=109957 RepID=A0AAD5XKR9_9FUNG|nr:hypothetical protein HK100_004989 [Physocladia obscura]
MSTFMATVARLDRTRVGIKDSTPYLALAQYFGTDERTSHAYGVDGAGLDFYTQQAVLVRILAGKHDWTTAGDIAANTSATTTAATNNHTMARYTAAVRKFEKVVHDVVGVLLNIVVAPSGSGGGGFVGTAYAAARELRAAWSEVGAGCEVTREISAVRASVFVGPVIFGVAADVMADAAYRSRWHENRQVVINGLFSMLRVPTIAGANGGLVNGNGGAAANAGNSGRGAAEVHYVLLEAAAGLHRGSVFGMCEECGAEVVLDPDVSLNKRIVYVSARGGGVFVGESSDSLKIEEGSGGGEIVGGSDDVSEARKATLEAAAAIAAAAAARSNARGGSGGNGNKSAGVQMFPCLHFYGTAAPVFEIDVQVQQTERLRRTFTAATTTSMATTINAGGAGGASGLSRGESFSSGSSAGAWQRHQQQQQQQLPQYQYQQQQQQQRQQTPPLPGNANNILRDQSPSSSFRDREAQMQQQQQQQQSTPVTALQIQRLQKQVNINYLSEKYVK